VNGARPAPEPNKQGDAAVNKTILRTGTLGAGALALVMLSASAGAVSIKGDKITLRMGSGHPPFITYVKEMSKYFAPRVVARVEKETKYTIRFREHYSGTVVNVFDTLEGIQDGRLDIGGFCVCFDDDKAMGLNLGYFVPFSHPNAKVATKIFRGIVDKYPAIAQDYGKRYNQKLIGLSGFNNYGLLTKFNWEKFEDLKGHKILAAGPNLPWVKGGIPVRTTIPKAAQQLQTGVGEGIVLFPDTDFKLKLHEAIGGGYYTVTDFGAVVQISLNMNLDARKKLPAAVLKIIDEEARAFETHSAATGHNDHDWGIAKLKGAGVTIKTITPSAKKAWAMQLKAWPNERAQAVKAKKGIDMPTIMRAFIKANEDVGHKYPVDYPIN
jgi:TRAP-type C4-dicarboxylate transport system substrate-binding protein